MSELRISITDPSQLPFLSYKGTFYSPKEQHTGIVTLFLNGTNPNKFEFAASEAKEELILKLQILKEAAEQKELEQLAEMEKAKNSKVKFQFETPERDSECFTTATSRSQKTTTRTNFRSTTSFDPFSSPDTKMSTSRTKLVTSEKAVTAHQSPQRRILSAIIQNRPTDTGMKPNTPVKRHKFIMEYLRNKRNKTRNSYVDLKHSQIRVTCADQQNKHSTTSFPEKFDVLNRSMKQNSPLTYQQKLQILNSVSINKSMKITDNPSLLRIYEKIKGTQHNAEMN